MGHLPSTIISSGRRDHRRRGANFMVLFCSMRRNDGRSLGEMVKMEMGPVAGGIALVGTLAIASHHSASALGLIVVKALGESRGAPSPWQLPSRWRSSWASTCAISDPARSVEASIFGVVVLLLTIWYGRHVAADATLGSLFTYTARNWLGRSSFYGAIASMLPVWLLLAPRDYLSTFLKIGVIVALALGIYIVMPDLKMPAVTRFIDGSGPVFSAPCSRSCSSPSPAARLSGFHALISSGTTPKMIERESMPA
ncbi:MAG: carbon starvation CstA family protein [Candidatus Competibacteraceae bacterium]